MATARRGWLLFFVFFVSFVLFVFQNHLTSVRLRDVGVSAVNEPMD